MSFQTIMTFFWVTQKKIFRKMSFFVVVVFVPTMKGNGVHCCFGPHRPSLNKQNNSKVNVFGFSQKLHVWIEVRVHKE